RHPDAFTARLKGLADGWRDTGGWADDKVAEQVRADGIDVLVDLGGHMDNARLPLFARRPAPVQVTYLGYPDTTGLAAFDGRLTDEAHDPPGQTDRFHTEPLVRLGAGCWAYAFDDDAPDPGPPPALGRGHVTFACLNRPAKTS